MFTMAIAGPAGWPDDEPVGGSAAGCGGSGCSAYTLSAPLLASFSDGRESAGGTRPRPSDRVRCRRDPCKGDNNKLGVSRG